MSSRSPGESEARRDRPSSGSDDAPHRSSAGRPWTAPTLEALPRLTDLTLQTGGAIGGDGGTGGGGSTVF